MAEIQSRILIIDASVARAAGGIAADAPVPKQCRDFLSEVFVVCHKVGITHGIDEEWRKHASRFTMHWLTNMASRGKRKQISSTKNASLRRKISSDISTSTKRKDMEKDTILVEAALTSHGIVVSLDETARELFQNLSLKANELNEICWVNPTNEDETPIQWLHDGALTEKRTFDYKRKTQAKTRQEKRHKM